MDRMRAVMLGGMWAACVVAMTRPARRAMADLTRTRSAIRPRAMGTTTSARSTTASEMTRANDIGSRGRRPP